MKIKLLKTVIPAILLITLAGLSGCEKEQVLLVPEIVGKWQLIEIGTDEDSSLTPVDTAADGIHIREYFTNMTLITRNAYNGVWNQSIDKYYIDDKHLTIMYCDENGNYDPDCDVHIYEYRFEDNNNYLITHHIQGELLMIYPQYLWYKYKRIN